MKRTLAFYIRLSISDADIADDGKEESNSITSQRKLLYAYIRSHEEFTGYEVLEYFDDGVSGTGFENRTEFQKMLADAQAGKFECLLVKDFSRFGRDYLEVGNYMEFVFPVMGIRFISVNDGYDSKQQNGMTGGMDVAFRNLIYQMYSRDLSRKVKSARRNRNEQGEYTASFTAFGYRKDPTDKHKLIVDEPAAEVVKEIFALAAGGKSAAEIARILNERKTPTRPQRQWERGINFKPKHNMGDYLWENTTVLAVIRNPIYKGTLIQNRYEMIGFGDDKKIVKRDKSEWSVMENQVPAIISRELFDKVNSLICRHAGSKQKPTGVNLFYCPYYGRKLRKTRHKPKYVCGVRNMNPDMPCGKIFMEKGEAEQMVLETVREACRMRLDTLEFQKQTSNKKETSGCLLAELEREKQRVQDNAIQLYKEYASGGCSKEEYLSLRQSNQNLLGELESKTGSKCYWQSSSIERIIRNEVYTGTLVQLKTRMESVGGKQIKRPKEEWVRVENTHEAIVGYSQYIRAVSSLKQQKATERKRKKNMDYCGCCGRALFNVHCGTVFCRQRSYKTDSACKEIEIRKQDAGMAVLAAVKQQATLYLDREKLSKQVIKRNSSLSVGAKINALVKAMETAQQGWIALYDKYADGKMDRNNFISEKKKYDADMERMEEELAALRQRQEEEEQDVQQDSDGNTAEALAFLEENELTEDMKDKLIEKVMVYAEGRNEVVWKFENNVEMLNIG